MVTRKQISKLQNAAIKQTSENLSGAAKLYSTIFSNSTDLKALCKELELPIEAAVKVAAIAKDKGKVVTICSQMLPKVNDTFVRFALYEKKYNDKKEDTEKGTPAKGDQWLKDNAVEGKEFKPFGFASPTANEIVDGRAWLIKKSESFTATYIAVKQATFSVRLVAKCVAEYLSHESQS